MTLTSKGSSFTLDPENDVKYDPCNTSIINRINNHFTQLSTLIIVHTILLLFKLF